MENQKREVQLDALMPVIKEKLNLGAEVSIISSGNSMYPLFRDKQDVVCLEQITEEVKKYDMVLYQREKGKYVLHRIVGIGADGYILRGDHQYVNEYPITAEQLIAKVGSFQRNGRQVNCEKSICYRIYARVWVNTSFLRRKAAGAKGRVYRAVRRLRKELTKGGK